MAGGAIARKSRRHMIRIGGLGEVGEMATRAVGRHAGEAVSGMAGVTGQRRMHSGERKIRKAGVVEARGLPAVHGMAVLTCGGQPRSRVIEDAIRLKVLRVATDALRAESDVLPDRRAFVAGIAG